jgi:hypothetical protein
MMSSLSNSSLGPVMDPMELNKLNHTHTHTKLYALLVGHRASNSRVSLTLGHRLILIPPLFS